MSLLSSAQRARSGMPSSAVLRARIGMPSSAVQSARIGMPELPFNGIVDARTLHPDEIYTFHNNECVPGEPCGWSNTEPASLAELSARRSELNGQLPEATALESGSVLRPRLDQGGVWGNWRDSRMMGTLGHINKNGSLVAIGETNPLLSSRTAREYLAEARQIMRNPVYTDEDDARVGQLIRMARILNEQYAERVRAQGATRLNVLVNGISRGREAVGQGLSSLWQRVTRRRNRSGSRHRSGSRSRSGSRHRSGSRSRSGSRNRTP
jgi:hypothetical protein